MPYPHNPIANEAMAKDALEDSIAKYRAASNGDHNSIGGVGECPLCALFHGRCNAEVGYRSCCYYCPVQLMTGKSCCHGSPYDEITPLLRYYSIENKDRLNAACIREAEFLESCRSVFDPES